MADDEKVNCVPGATVPVLVMERLGLAVSRRSVGINFDELSHLWHTWDANITSRDESASDGKNFAWSKRNIEG